jgi:peptide deformylase
MTYLSASDLPDYVILNDPQEKRVAVLSTPAQPLTFPLSNEDKESVRILVAKFDQAEKCAGLAAPQIGIGKQIIVFVVPDDPNFKKFRPDLVQTMPKTVWINPSYEPLGEEMTTAIEGCFSVMDIAGSVGRYTKIRYKAFTVEGAPIEGVAEGYLARVIQHEVDHINGRCFIDLVPEKERFSMDEYWIKREAAMNV